MAEHIFSSEAASSIEVTKIKLPNERMIQYRNSYLFDLSKRKGKLTEEERAAGITKSNLPYLPIPRLIEALAQSSERINMLFTLINFLVVKGGQIQDIEFSDGADAVSEFINKSAEAMTLNLSEDTMSETVDTKEYKAKLASVFNGMNSGRMLIEDSKVHSGGKDVYFNGDHGNSGASWGRELNYDTVKLKRGSDSNYSNRYNGDYTTPLSLSLLEVVKKFRADVLGGGSLDTIHKREHKTFALNYNFEKWRSRFERAGLTLRPEIMARLLRNIPMTEREITNAKGFLSGCITHDVSSDIYEANSPWNNYISKRGQYEDAGSEKPSNVDHYCPIGSALSKQFSFSLCLHVPEDIVNYITQTEDKNQQLFKLHTWSKAWAKTYVRVKNSKATKKGEADTGGLKKVPPFVLSPSILPQLSEERKAAGLPVVDKIGDENNIAVNPNGDLIYIPAKDDFDPRQSEKHEQLNEDILRTCFEHGMPPQESKDITSNLAMAHRISNEDRDNKLNDTVNGIREELKSFEGQLLGYDLDFGILIYAGQSSTAMNTVRLNGTTKPEALAIADFLGYDFSGEGESPNFKTFRTAMVRMLHKTIMKDVDDVQIAQGNYLNAVLLPLLRTYIYMMEEDPTKYPKLQALVHRAFADLKIEDLREDELNNMQGYYRYMNEKGNLIVPDSPSSFIYRVTEMLGVARDNASASGFNSKLYQILLKEFDNNASTVANELEEDHRYFDEGKSTMAKFGNLYNHLGGRILLYICEALANTSPKILLAPKYNAQLEASEIKFPDFRFVSMTVMPTAIMFSKYVPDAERIFERAEEVSESLVKQEGFTADDLTLPGLAEGTQMFPHQLDSMATLQNKPKFAILDISPGGGKTILGIADIVNLIGQGEKIKPLVICPDHLVTNWCDDMYKVTKGNWNVIPLSSKCTTGKDSKNPVWSDDELDEVFANAPINTILVAGINWIKNFHRQTTIAIGNGSVSMPQRVDLLRKHNYNYVLLDESHKAKKYDPGVKVSGVHDALKMVTTYLKVDYVRLATGTLVPDKVKDIVGQVNLFTASVFGTPDYLEMDVDLKERDDAPFLVRSKLAQHVALITKKRKDWAFMLPNPIDSFITCRFGRIGADDGSSVQVTPNMDTADLNNQQQGDILHYVVYQAVLNDAVKAMEEDAKKKKKGGGDDDDDSEDDDDESDKEEGGYSSGDDGIVDTDDEGNEIEGAMTASAMGIHLNRLEQLLTDPWGDVAFQQQAKELGIKRKGFVPVKIRSVIDRLDNHFKRVKYEEGNVGSPHQGVIKWEKGMRHRELDLVDYQGVTYMARNMEDEGSAGRSIYPEASNSPPPQDPSRWKVERTGKVLVFCRYTRTVEAVYKALPSRYKNVARRFHGKLGKYAQEDKWRNLEEFRKGEDDGVQILIANEQAITEGQNLQIASRIIRVEAPWSPGDYEQATARIFRPDVAAAKLGDDGKPGDMAREVIFIDWIMAEGTLEVPKVGRLIAKTIETTKFGEKGNPRYNDLEKLDIIPMGLPMLREVQTSDQIAPYFAAKAQLNDIEQREFWEMRKTTVAAMIPIPSSEPHPDFRKLDYAPVSPNVILKDDKFKFERYSDYVQANQEQIEADKAEAFKGIPVRTPFGMGMIVGVSAMRNMPDPSGEKYTEGKDKGKVKRVLDAGDPVSNFRIRLADNSKVNGKYKPGEMFTVPPSMCHFATEISDEEYEANFKSSKVWSTETERKKIAKAAEVDAVKAREERDEADKRESEIQKEVAKEQRRIKRIQNRIRNQQENKPINEGVNDNIKPMPKDGIVGKPVDMRVKMHIGVYNGFFGIVGELKDPDLHSFDKEFDFTDFGKYIYLDLKTYADFEALADWLDTRESKKGGGWILDKATTLKNLTTILEVFDANDKDKFSQKLAIKPQQEINMFLQKKLRKPTGKDAEKKIRLYPIITQDRVRVCIDVATSPKLAEAFLRYAPIKNHKGFAGQTNGKWLIQEGMTVFFCSNKTEAKKKLTQIIKAGYKITNLKSMGANLEKLKPVRARTHKLS